MAAKLSGLKLCNAYGPEERLILIVCFSSPEEYLPFLTSAFPGFGVLKPSSPSRAGPLLPAAFRARDEFLAVASPQRVNCSLERARLSGCLHVVCNYVCMDVCTAAPAYLSVCVCLYLHISAHSVATFADSVHA